MFFLHFVFLYGHFILLSNVQLTGNSTHFQEDGEFTGPVEPEVKGFQHQDSSTHQTEWRE